jgi:hypothetical protein
MNLEPARPRSVDGGLTGVDPLGLHAEPSHSRDQCPETAADVQGLAAGDHERVIEPVAPVVLGQ